MECMSLRPGQKLVRTEVCHIWLDNPGTRRVSLNRLHAIAENTPPPRPGADNSLQSGQRVPQRGARHHSLFGPMLGPLTGHSTTQPGMRILPSRPPSQNSKSRCVCPGLAVGGSASRPVSGRLGHFVLSGNSADQSGSTGPRRRRRRQVVWVWFRHDTCASWLAILIY